MVFDVHSQGISTTSLLVIGRGVIKIVKGVAKGDVVDVARGTGSIAMGAAGTIVTHTLNEELGEVISLGGEAVAEDEDVPV